MIGIITKQKISESHKRKKYSEEIKIKMDNSHKKSILQLSKTGEVIKVCKGTQKTSESIIFNVWK